MDSTGQDQTLTYLMEPSWVFFLVMVDVMAAGADKLKAMEVFYSKAYEAGYSAIGLTASLPEDVAAAARESGLTIPFFNTDDTELKAMVRSNPGLVLMKNGTVIKKWHWRDLPR